MGVDAQVHVRSMQAEESGFEAPQFNANRFSCNVLYRGGGGGGGVAAAALTEAEPSIAEYQSSTSLLSSRPPDRFYALRYTKFEVLRVFPRVLGM